MNISTMNRNLNRIKIFVERMHAIITQKKIQPNSVRAGHSAISMYVHVLLLEAF